jgi:hypothetical protein
MRTLSPRLPDEGPGEQRPSVIPLEPESWPRPLPDPVAIRRVAVPDWGPPYDDADSHDDADCHDQADCRDQQEQPEEPAEGAGQTAEDKPEGAGSSEWAGRFAQVLAETLAGSRPAQQVRPWTTEQARRRIRQLGPMLQADQRPRVRRVLMSMPCTGVVEMTVVVSIGPRVRALAVRLERPDEADLAPPAPRPAPAQRRAENRASLRAEPGRVQPGGWLCTAIEAA